MRVQLIAKPDQRMTGLLRYALSLRDGLLAERVDVSLLHPSPPPIPGPIARGAMRLGLDPLAFFGSYPMHVQLNGADIYHLASQNLATVLLFQRIEPVVVTVHDIIPYLVRHDRELSTYRHVFDRWFDRLALFALRKADAIIAISEYTKRTLVEHLGYSPDRIHVVYRAVDTEVFRPREVPPAFRQRYGLSEDGQYVLYVGSDDPRKNLRTLIRAFALVKRQIKKVKLVKVGAPHFGAEREKLIALIAELELENDVLFFDHVPDDDFPLFYNTAQVLVLPSLYEGFGLPVLEAMACGVPVIAARLGPLPEVVDGAGILIEPTDVEGMAEELCRVLMDRDYWTNLGQAALARSRHFGLERQGGQTIEVYNQVASAL
jgi:glycosyltransferase involved in cell wall biosynthesis